MLLNLAHGCYIGLRQSINPLTYYAALLQDKRYNNHTMFIKQRVFKCITKTTSIADLISEFCDKLWIGVSGFIDYYSYKLFSSSSEPINLKLSSSINNFHCTLETHWDICNIVLYIVALYSYNSYWWFSYLEAQNHCLVIDQRTVNAITSSSTQLHVV